jgi:hypothetical protein
MANENIPPTPNNPATPLRPPSINPQKPGLPPLPGKAPPLPPTAGEPVQMAPEGEPGVPLSFWQLPWVQNILPFATSVVVHAGILIIGIVFFYGIQYVTNKMPHVDEVIIPDA